MAKVWTPARVKAFIISALRAGSAKWPPKHDARKKAYLGKRTNPKTNRTCSFYKCKACGGEFPSGEIEMDHILQVVDPKTGFTTWDEYITRLFCPEENFQALCTECHSRKTKEENATKL